MFLEAIQEAGKIVLGVLAIVGFCVVIGGLLCSLIANVILWVTKKD